MRGGIPGVEEESYFISYLDSPKQGDMGTQCIMVPRGPDWDVICCSPGG